MKNDDFSISSSVAKYPTLENRIQISLYYDHAVKKLPVFKYRKFFRKKLIFEINFEFYTFLRNNIFISSNKFRTEFTTLMTLASTWPKSLRDIHDFTIC